MLIRCIVSGRKKKGKRGLSEKLKDMEQLVKTIEASPIIEDDKIELEYIKRKQLLPTLQEFKIGERAYYAKIQKSRFKTSFSTMKH